MNLNGLNQMTPFSDAYEPGRYLDPIIDIVCAMVANITDGQVLHWLTHWVLTQDQRNSDSKQEVRKQLSE